MDIDWNGLLLAPLHAGMGMDARIEPVDAAPFDASVIRHAPVAALNPFQGSVAATNLYVFEVPRSAWPLPKEGAGLIVPALGTFELQAFRPDERQPEIWLLDCVPTT